MLDELIVNQIFVFMLIFTRFGTALMIMPALGEGLVPARVRLLLALLVTLTMVPVLGDRLPQETPASPFALLFLLGGEFVVGLMLGLSARLLLTAMDVAGTLISFQMSLSNAFAFNPAMAAQGSLVGSFLTIMAITLIFVTDLHHLFFLAVAGSYEMFPPGRFPDMGDAADMIARLVAHSFKVGLQLAAPFIILGLTFYAGLGLLARLMPQVQIFFIAIPIQLILGITVLMLALSGMALFWLSEFETALFYYMRG